MGLSLSALPKQKKGSHEDIEQTSLNVKEMSRRRRPDFPVLLGYVEFYTTLLHIVGLRFTEPC